MQKLDINQELRMFAQTKAFIVHLLYKIFYTFAM